MKFLFAAGGTGGTLTPGIATFQEILKKDPEASLLVVGDKSPHAEELCKTHRLAYLAIPEAKLRRYFTWKNFLAPFKLLSAFFQSRQILKNYKPDIVFGAGGYSEVPVILAAWQLSIPILIHQQDVAPVRSNLICKWFASEITVAFENSVKDFWVPKGFLRTSPIKVTVIGNPTLASVETVDRSSALRRYGLADNKPVLLVFGGGTGSAWLNNAVSESVETLLQTFQILHITGFNHKTDFAAEGYKQLEFEPEMRFAYSCSDLVICRGGLGTLTEISYFQKPAVIIPLPNSPQIQNARFAEDQGAVVTVTEEESSPESLADGVLKLWENKDFLIKLKSNIKNLLPTGASQALAEILLSYGKKS